MEAVLDDPSRNRREELLALAREVDGQAVTERTGAGPDG